MNTAVYPEPHRLTAGILALLVHCAFFVLLYFGVSWQTQPLSSPAMSVELWQTLPEPAAAPPVTPVVEKPLPPTPPPPPPVEEIKPDIAIPEKKPVKKIEVKREEVKPPEKTTPEPLPKPKPEVKPEVKPDVKKPPVTKKATSQSVQSMPAVSAAQQQAARDKADKEAATGRVVDEYVGKIQSKIRRNIVMPPDVPNDARAEFLVTLLPGGSVLSARLTRSSGNTAYDNAVERGILKSDPLPLPSDSGMFSRFRELKLSFKPVE